MLKIAVTARPKIINDHQYDIITAELASAVTIGNMIPFVIPLCETAKNRWDDITKICDGIIIAGSEIDVSPELYGEKGEPPQATELDIFDKRAILTFAGKNKPILGICRGIQILNVVFGGSLHQNIEAHCFDRAGRHTVAINKGNIIYDVYGGNAAVSSTHHQAVKQIAPPFTVAAKADDGTIEAVYHTENPKITGIQWHPEYMENDNFIGEFFHQMAKKS